MSTLRASLELPINRAAAFELLVDELAAALERQGLELEPGPQGRIAQGGRELGRVTAWIPGERVVLAWNAPGWEPERVTEVELRLTEAERGTRVAFEHRGWGASLGEAGEGVGWFAHAVAAPLLAAASPAVLGDWLTDRLARSPCGARARAIYGDPLFHYPNFRVILDTLGLGPGDYLVEVGCGGGKLLEAALRSGCHAAGVDHSPEMVALTRAVNGEAIAAGRLDVRLATAESLPFADGAFTHAAMTGVLGFLGDAVAALREIRRVLRPGGRLVALGSDPELRGTPAAPEPVASRIRFYDDGELEALGLEAGFAEVEVLRRDLAAYAREAGVPEEALPLFAGPGPGARFLTCRR